MEPSTATGEANAAAPLYIIWVTCVTDSTDHAVTDEDLAAGITSAAGIYPAICGAVVVPAPMLAAPCSTCPQCAAVLRADADREDAQRPTRRRPFSNFVSRVFRRRKAQHG